MPTARLYVRTEVLDGKLYVAGGLGTAHNHLSSVERYDLATKAWEVVAPMATARDGHAVGTRGTLLSLL